MSRYLLLLMLGLSLSLLLVGMLSAERPTPAPGRAGRSVTMAPHGMVCCSHPLAGQVGLDVLKQGGNAVDAAIATNAALGLMEPMSGGIGGGLHGLVWAPT